MVDLIDVAWVKAQSWKDLNIGDLIKVDTENKVYKITKLEKAFRYIYCINNSENSLKAIPWDGTFVRVAKIL